MNCRVSRIYSTRDDRRNVSAVTERVELSVVDATGVGWWARKVFAMHNLAATKTESLWVDSGVEHGNQHPGSVNALRGSRGD
ncbi:unannotated protein [freshwater metagenome]|uniref:Unannotated protein n=1 Tax=freshwater metagenome TaxID=449393 RepID=A0A6J7KV88_9ZZZZ